jgi:alkanesulfonate monooxygenase SsuD/methylene tetrahydromethanopterin reductase-like flavin-dependent oxidoreductase (luciferase family)
VTDLGLMFSFRNPATTRRPFPEVYREELRLVRDAETLGYDTVWLTEHHFADDGYSPSILPIAAAIAATTERIRIGLNLLLLPLHNPIRVAEDIATLDVISDGRIDVGLGQGYAPHEFDGYGIPLSERRSRFVEGIEILQGLWTSDRFDHDGPHHHIRGANLTPKPVQQPHPPLWIGATAEAGVRRAGRLGANLLGLASTRLQRAYEEALRDGGHDPDRSKVLQLHWAHVAPTDDEAWAQAAPSFHHVLSVYAGWANASADADKGGPRTVVPQVEELRSSERLMFTPQFGSPDTVAAGLRASMAQVRTTHLALGVLPALGYEATRRSMELFITEAASQLP